MDYKNILISEDMTVLQAIERLNTIKIPRKILFIVRNDVLIGALSDGDVRRWLLSKGHLDAPVMNAANTNPKHLHYADRGGAVEFMRKNDIQALPIVDKNRRIKNIVLWNETEVIVQSEKIDAPVVMMAGGLGTRLYPYTKILPKPLIPIGDIPIAEHIINSFVKFGCSEFYLVVNHKRNMIKAYFNEIQKPYKIVYVDEEKPLGTGGGLSLLKGTIDKTFILTNCDILITEDIAEIYKFHCREKNLITMVCSLKTFTIPYGVVEIDADGGIESMKEKPQLSFFTNTGCYIIEPEVLNQIENDTVIGVPEIVEKCKSAGQKVGVYPISENSWMDMGQMDELEKMRFRLNMEG